MTDTSRIPSSDDGQPRVGNCWSIGRIPLKDLKESNPIEVAEYAVAIKLVIRDRNVMKVKSRYHVRTHKFGIEVPKTINRAFLVKSILMSNIM